MGYKFNEILKSWEAWHSARHPITRMPYQLRRRAKTKAEARRLEKQLIAEVTEALHRKITPSWSQTMDTCLASMRNQGVTAKTVDNYALCLKAHTLAVWGDRLIDKITTDEIRELIIDKLKAKAPSHQKNVLKFIRKIFTFAVELGTIDRDPTPRLKFRVGDKIKGVLTEPQVKKFLDTAKEMEVEWYQIWVMALYTGMRNGELFALTWEKVNLEQRTIVVDCAWNNKDGFKDTKSGDDRVLEIAPNLLSMLQELKLRSRDSIFVLPRLDKWEKGEQARELRLFLAGLSLPRIRFHDLRATWATMMLSKGIEPIKVMKMGGWKDIKTLMIYTRKAGVDIRGITDRLDLHNPSRVAGKVINLQLRSEE